MSDHNQLKILWALNFRAKRKSEISRLEFFRKIPFFENLTTKQLKLLSRFLHERRYEENEFLFEISHPGAAIFIISSGEISIEIGNESIAIIKPGEFLGEMALLDDSPRSASARATKPTVAYALSRAELTRLEKEDPVISTEIFKTLAWIIGERLRASNRFLGNKKQAAA